MFTITDIKARKGRRGGVEVWLDGEVWRLVAPDTAVLFGLKKGLRLDDGRLEEIVASDDRLRARQLLARYTALSLRSTRQARDYLRRRGLSDAAIEAAVEHGLERQWLDDRRYAEAYVRHQNALRPSGPAKLRAELRGRGVETDDVERAIERFGPDDEAQRAAAEQVARKRLVHWGNRYDAPTLRRKLAEHLARKGYAEALIWSVIDDLGIGAE